MGETIACANQKGGVGKTTTVVNVGAYLALAGDRVLVIDLDPQGNATSGLGVDRLTLERSVYEAVMDLTPLDTLVRSSPVPGLDLIPAAIALAGAEVELAAVDQRERRLGRLIGPLADRYDYVLIDTPPSLGLLTINALVAATGVIVPVQCEYLSLRGLVQLENTLAMIRENLNPHVGIQGILPTMFDRRLLHSREAVEILKENFGDLVLNTRIRKTVRYAEAPVKGQSIMKYDPSGEAADMYRDLAKEVLDGAKAAFSAGGKESGDGAVDARDLLVEVRQRTRQLGGEQAGERALAGPILAEDALDNA